MNKLSKKFMIGIGLILIVTGLSAVLINKNYVAKYYVNQKKNELNNVSDEFVSKIAKTNVAEAIRIIENDEKVIIVETAKDHDNEKVNNEIRDSFNKKGIGFKKLWLWDQDYEDVISGVDRIRLYEQEKLNYSVLVKYLSLDEEIYAIAMIVPNIEDSFSIVNTFFAITIGIMLVLSMIFIIILVRRIIKPLNEFEQFAKNMGEGHFIPLDIETKDELEEVANTLNKMGQDVVSYQEELTEKKHQMEDLLNNVAHDLKTPVSLIKLYSEGIKDNLDDGTFVETIIDQSTEMNTMIEKILLISKVEKMTVEKINFNFSEQVNKVVKEHGFLMNERQIILVSDLEKNIMINSNEEWLNSIISNLISNSIKYTSKDELSINLTQSENNIIFNISNEVDNTDLDLKRIWDPYYVGEQSRSKELSGTGLGLYQVKKMVDQLGFEIDVKLEGNKITFRLIIR